MTLIGCSNFFHGNFSNSLTPPTVFFFFVYFLIFELFGQQAKTMFVNSILLLLKYTVHSMTIFSDLLNWSKCTVKTKTTWDAVSHNAMCLTYPSISNVMCKNLHDMTFCSLVTAVQNAYIIQKQCNKTI